MPSFLFNFWFKFYHFYWWNLIEFCNLFCQRLTLSCGYLSIFCRTFCGVSSATTKANPKLTFFPKFIHVHGQLAVVVRVILLTVTTLILFYNFTFNFRSSYWFETFCAVWTTYKKGRATQNVNKIMVTEELVASAHYCGCAVRHRAGPFYTKSWAVSVYYHAIKLSRRDPDEHVEDDDSTTDNQLTYFWSEIVLFIERIVSFNFYIQDAPMSSPVLFLL